MSKEISVTVIGDILLDIYGDTGGHSFRDITQNVLVFRPLDAHISGTAVNFATSALEWFSPVNLICKMGGDLFSALIINHLRESGVTLHYNTDPALKTGLAVKISEITPQKQVRLLVVEQDPASRHLTVEDVSQFKDVLAQSDLLVIDGYCFLDQPRRDASFKAMEIAHRAGAKIAFDVVPHHAYELYDLAELKHITKYANAIIIELKAICEFLGTKAPDDVFDKDVALSILPLLLSEFEGKSFFLRFGIDNVSESLICVPGKQPQHNFTGWDPAKKTQSFGDNLAACELAEHFPSL
jgi:sugar/nucleoside kinase (ribokinase family)